MSILNRLSSQTGDRTEQSNREAAAECVHNPELLKEIAGALTGKNTALVGDCAEVMTMTAEKRPESVSPYIDALVPLLAHKTTRVRWEATHAIAYVARLVPEQMNALFPRLAEMIRKDTSTIVRDYSIDAVGNAASIDEAYAEIAFPILKEALTAWDGKHAGRVLAGLVQVVKSKPALSLEALQIGTEYADHAKPVVRKAAKKLVEEAKQ